MDALLERTFRVEQRHFWFRGFRRFVTPLLVGATASRQHSRLLDAGCGTGANLLMLGQYGAAFGLELQWRGLRLARERGLTRLARGTVAHLPFTDASLDVVLSFDVLYCLEDAVERAAIAEMFRVLKSGGAAIINVAALDMLKGDHSALTAEVRRYTRPQLRERLERAGFHVARITYTNASLFPMIATVRALQRLRGVKTDAEHEGDFYMPPAPVNALL
jgi:SAM-dependent methyltransferase